MEDEEDETEVLLVKKKSSSLPLQQTSFHEATVELKRIKTGLMWVFLDQSNIWRACLSWSVFCLLTIVVPLVSHIVFSTCTYSSSSCEKEDHRRRMNYDGIVQISLSIFATLSFISVSSFERKYGVRKFLFLDKLGHDNDKVRQGYTQQIHTSMRLLSAFVLPCFLVDGVYKIWWFASTGSQIPYIYNPYFSNIIVCILLMVSWLYRLSISLLVCVLFRLICYLQILRLEDYAQVFEKESDVTYVLLEHLRIRRNLRVISHRFRVFILSTLILVTASQFVSLIVTIQDGSRTRTRTNIYNTGELVLCSIILVTGLFICLRSAAKITHKAQSITSLAAKWHICATINSFDYNIDETRICDIPTDHKFYHLISNSVSDDDDEVGDGDDEIDNTKFVGIQTQSMSYQKRQALVTYFEHNRAGITVYGFMLDRTCLHMIFAIELSLMLWILNKTINSI